METKKSLKSRVRAIAESGKAKGMPNKFNLPQNKENREAHIEICKRLAEMSDANGGYPITYLVYFAIGKSAHKTDVFLKGYNNFNEKKAKTILEWLNMFAKHNGNPKLFTNGNLAHALCRFYDKYSTSTEDFLNALSKYEPNPKVLNFKSVCDGLGIAKTPTEVMAEAESFSNC